MFRIICKYRINFNKELIFRRNFLINVVKKPYSNRLQHNKSVLSVNNAKYLSIPAAKNSEPQNIDKFDELKIEIVSNKRAKLKKLLDILGNEELSDGQLLFLLQSCGHQLPDCGANIKQVVIDKIWNKLSDHSSMGYQIFLTVCKENAFVVKDFDLLLENKSIELLLKLLAASAETGNVQQVDKVIRKLKSLNVGLTENIANQMILAYSRNRNLKACEDVLESIEAANIEKTSATYTEVIKAYIENSHPEKAEKLIAEKGLLLEDTHVYEILRSCIFQNQSQLVPNLVKCLPTIVSNNPSIDPNLRNIFSQLLICKKYDEITSLLDALPIPTFNINEDSDTYASFLINEFTINCLETENLLKFTSYLVESGRNLRALHVACESTFRNQIGNSMNMLAELAKIEPLRPHYFWPTIIHNFNENGEAGVLEVLKLMSELNVDIDNDTILAYILPKLSITLQTPKKSMKLLLDCNVKLTQFMTPLTSYLLTQQRYKDILDIHKLYPTKLNTEILIYPLVMSCTIHNSERQVQTMAKLVKLFNDKSLNSDYDLGGHLLMELITNYKTKNDSSFIKALLDEYTVFGIKISKAADEILRNYFIKKQINVEENLKSILNKSLTIPAIEATETIITHPRDMTLEELECHLVELESKNLNTRGVLRRVLQLCVQKGKYDRALEVKKKCDELKVDISSGMMASVFEMYIKTKRLTAADSTLKDMKKNYPGFMIDDHKIIDFSALLVENGEFEKAKKVLKERANAAKIKLGPNNHKNIWHLLNLVAHYSALTAPESEANQTEEMLAFLVDVGYCEYHNALLGPIIREHLLKCQNESVIKMYKKIVKNYRKTPLQQEVLTLLVKLSNQSDDPNFTTEMAKKELQELVKISSKIHGQINTNGALVIAFAEAGTEGQLRKLLMNPEVRIKTETLVKQCEYLCNSGKLSAILKLAKCSRNLKHIKENDFLNMVLDIYVRQNDTNSAVKLFNEIESDDEFKMTHDFARKVNSLLERNNLEVPSNVLLHCR